MSTLTWVVIGVATYLLLSAWAALGLAAFFGRINRGCDGSESETWSTTPTERERSEVAQEMPIEQRLPAEPLRATRNLW
jgi:hypothetical protein